MEEHYQTTLMLFLAWISSLQLQQPAIEQTEQQSLAATYKMLYV
jgi:hypothetical protein